VKYEELKPKAPPPLPQEERDTLATQIREKSQNQNREHIAREIEAGDLYNDRGEPKGYWHCLATQKPEVPDGWRGQWKAIGEQPSGWEWQDWGRVRKFNR
jgi:hypothetical protein